MNDEKSSGMVLCKISTHSLICESRCICLARAHILYAFLPFWKLNTVPSCPFFKGTGRLLGKDLEITEAEVLGICRSVLEAYSQNRRGFPKIRA